jgi:L-ascorbate metabolism protein UlaG (beta-lactamase superfamily)
MRLFKLISIILIVILSAYIFTQKRYQNISEGGTPNMSDLIKWKLTREKAQWPSLPKVNNVTPVKLQNRINGDEAVVTYINHASFLIQMNGLNILTDPIWSEYAGPFGKFGVKRTIYPGLNIEQLPKIDFILISHSHYDHLDLPSIEALTKNNDNVKILMGLGVSKYIDYCKTTNNCKELDWWDHIENKSSDIEFHFVPAYHWSSRALFDYNTSLWGGFIIQNNKNSIYFAGDTGFGDGKVFTQIKNKFSNITLSLLPIGAYKPNWFFKNMHTSPEDSVKIFKILGSEYAIPMHYDTFQLSDEEYKDPLIDLEQATIKQQIENDKFHILSPGQSWQFPY